MTTWITDDNGNRASVEYWGSKEAAEASLKTLRNCRNCINCSGCSDCLDCSYCSYCSGCSGCSDCSDCDLTSPHYRLPVSDPRGYTWLAILEDGAWRIRAGCRSYSIEEARKHWLADDYGGPASVRETVGFAMDWIAAKPAVQAQPEDERKEPKS